MPLEHFKGGHFNADDGSLCGPEGRSVKLRPKVATLLDTLLQSPNEVLSKEALIEAIWSDGVVDFEAGLSALLKELRSALVEVGFVDDPTSLIETLPRRGVRLNLSPSDLEGASEDQPVIEKNASTPWQAISWKRIAAPMLSVLMTLIVAWIVLSHDWQNHDEPTQGQVATDERRHTLAILPFEVYGGSPERMKAEGLLAADTLLSELWVLSLPETSLLGRASLAPYGDEPSTEWVSRLAEDLGASLIIEGRLIWSEASLSVNARLISTSNYEVLVSETIEIGAVDLERPAQIAKASRALAQELAQAWPTP